MKDFEELREEIIEKNIAILEKFEKYLQEKGLSDNTSYKHLSNLDFYANDYLINYGTEEDENGNLIMPTIIEGIHPNFIDHFLGNFFIRKCMWSNENTIKENITSFKKFYTFLEKEEGLISKKDLEELKKLIKEQKNEWIRKVNLYNDPNIDFEDIMDEFL